MEITGRLTANATTHTLKDGRQVVHFTVAINDRYRPKHAETFINQATFINASYWLNPGIAPHLIKGLIVECSGRIGLNAWKGMDGEARASLTFHVNSIRLHGKSQPTKRAASPAPDSITEPLQDLPF